jgi:hypothetical protein
MGSMIRDYRAFLDRRWNELDMPARIRAAADNEDAQRPIQVSWLVQVVGELRHTTLHEGRQHPDVGLLFKESGNHFDAGNGLKIATDIICVRDTNAAGDVTNPGVFSIVDGIVTVNRHSAHPGWIVNGMAAGADVQRFREPPVPGTTPVGPVDPVVVPDVGKPTAPIDNEAMRAVVQIAALLQDMHAAREADRAVQERILAALEGLRHDVNNAGKLLGALIGGGGLGNPGDSIKPQPPT